MAKEVKAPIHVFDLSGGALNGVARKFCNLTLNYGLIRQHFKPEQYDIRSGKGEQRGAIKRRVMKLKKELINHNFTPDTIHACAMDEHFNDNGDGTVTITFTNNPLATINGFQRCSALEKIRQEGGQALQRLIDNLPWPVVISLNPEKRKTDFLNLNNGFAVSRAHMLQLSIDTNTVDHKYAKYFQAARAIALSLNDDKESPLCDLIQFDQTSILSPLNAAVLMTNRKTDQIMSFFGSTRILEIFDKDDRWFIDLFKQCYDIIVDNSSAGNTGMLLALPDDNSGKYKAGASFLIGIVNQLAYYMFLKKTDVLSPVGKKAFIKAVSVFEEEVAGDTSSKRRAILMREFAQSLFEEIVEDPNGKIAGHFGIPYPLITFFSPGSFGVDSPGKPVKAKTNKSRKKKENVPKVDSKEIVVAEPTVTIDSDTDLEWID